MGNDQKSNRNSQFQSLQPENFFKPNNPSIQPNNEGPPAPKFSNENNYNNNEINENIQKQAVYQPTYYERPYVGRPLNPYDVYYQKNNITAQNTNLNYQQPQNDLKNNNQNQQIVINRINKSIENTKKVVTDIDRVALKVAARPEKKKAFFRGNLVKTIFFE